jgi:hypothetical protein
MQSAHFRAIGFVSGSIIAVGYYLNTDSTSAPVTDQPDAMVIVKYLHTWEVVLSLR